MRHQAGIKKDALTHRSLREKYRNYINRTTGRIMLPARNRGRGSGQKPKTTRLRNMKKTTLISFMGNEGKCVSGVTKIHNSNLDGVLDRTYVAHDKSNVFYRSLDGYISFERHGYISILHETEPQFVPHDMQSFPRDGWFSWKDTNEIFRALRLNSDGIFLFNGSTDVIHQPFDYLLEHAVQVYPDNTTSPCGKEIMAKGDK